MREASGAVWVAGQGLLPSELSFVPLMSLPRRGRFLDLLVWTDFFFFFYLLRCSWSHLDIEGIMPTRGTGCHAGTRLCEPIL